MVLRQRPPKRMSRKLLPSDWCSRFTCVDTAKSLSTSLFSDASKQRPLCMLQQCLVSSIAVRLDRMQAHAILAGVLAAICKLKDCNFNGMHANGSMHINFYFTSKVKQDSYSMQPAFFQPGIGLRIH